MDIKLSAEVYRIGVSIGLLTIEDIMKWADNVIEQYYTPPCESEKLSSGNIPTSNSLIEFGLLF